MAQPDPQINLRGTLHESTAERGSQAATDAAQALALREHAIAAGDWESAEVYNDYAADALGDLDSAVNGSNADRST
jgi:hypothetical protein